MPRGGYREGAGGRPSWRHGKTKPVRVPEALAEKIIEIARILDEEGSLQSVETEIESKIIDLTGVAILYSKSGPVVRLADLIRVGYEIKPERLTRNLKVNTSEPLGLDGLLSEGEEDESDTAF